ncbi:MAG: THUMP domain-containing protein [Candidatus Woesearchaeota archaeon]
MEIFIATKYPETCALEVKELIKKPSKIYENVCFVKDVSKQEITKLCYHLQSSERICVSLIDFEIQELKKQLEKIDSIEKSYLKNINSFEVRSERAENIDITSNELNKIIGDKINNITKLKVNLTNPDMTFYVVATNHFFVGIDVVGFDMSKRPYKITNQTDSLNGAFAYHLLRVCNIKKTSSIVDAFAGTGTIPIEAALFQSQISTFKFENKFNGFKLDFIKNEFLTQEEIEKKFKFEKQLDIYAYDGLIKHLLGIQKNSKLAGIDKNINSSKLTIDWLETKLDENSIDFIITDPPKFNKKLDNLKEIEKLMDELFYQAKFVLKNKGILAILTNRTEEIILQAKKHKFKNKNILELKRGEQIYYFMIFEK